MKKRNIFLITFLLTLVCGNLKTQGGNWSDNIQPFDEGNGSEQNPYIISTPKHLAYLAVCVKNNPLAYANKYYVLDADIDLGAHDWNLPIGTTSVLSFRGIFDGDNHKIFNMKGSASSDSEPHGLFGRTENAFIKNLEVEIINIIGSTSGGLIAHSNLSTVENCYVKGSDSEYKTISGRVHVGGFIGYARETTIKNSGFYGSIRLLSENDNIRGGGFIGTARAVTLINCYSEIEIYRGYGATGGFIGCLESNGSENTENNIIENCYSKCTLEGMENIGGFIGKVSDCTNVSITGCRSSGSAFGKKDEVSIGGFIGSFSGEGEISNCLAEVRVTGLGDNIGGFIGIINDTRITNISYCRARGSAEGLVDQVHYVGGFLGYYKDSDILNITNCSAEGNVTGTAFGAGGFIGGGYSHTGIFVSECYAGGDVKGIQQVGGFAGMVEGVFTDCFSTGAVEGEIYVGGFGGDFYDGNITNCYAAGSIKGINYVGGFGGLNYEASLVNCYATGTVFGETNTGAFFGYENYYVDITNCYFDRQTAGVTSPSGTGEVEGIQALPTSAMTNNSLSGFSEDKWFFSQGYYPQLKAFTESNEATARLRSALSVVPFRFVNDTETVSNVQNFIRLTDKTPTGNTIKWSANSIKINAEEWRLLTLGVGDVKRNVILRSENMTSAGDYLGVIINNNIFYNSIPAQFFYSIECNSKDESVFAEMVLSENATCMPAYAMMLYANQPQTITVTTAGGQTKTYSLTAEKHLSPEIFIQRWDDVLAINNNYMTNGGYNFTAYEWYKNGSQLPDTKGYIKETGGLNKSAEYTALLTTQQGYRLSTCPAVISSGLSPKISVYPNPVKSGQAVYVDTGTAANTLIQIFDSNGSLINRQTSQDSEIKINTPDMPGTYILQITEDGASQTYKITVE